MPNVSNMIRMGDLINGVNQASDINGVKKILAEILSRIDAQNNSIVDQIKSQATVYPVDPDVSPELLEGAKPGDVAIFKRYGAVDIKIYS